MHSSLFFALIHPVIPRRFFCPLIFFISFACADKITEHLDYVIIWHFAWDYDHRECPIAIWSRIFRIKPVIWITRIIYPFLCCKIEFCAHISFFHLSVPFTLIFLYYYTIFIFYFYQANNLDLYIFQLQTLVLAFLLY